MGLRPKARLLIPLAGLAAAAGVAQDAPQPIFSPQFSFSNPGARSMGLGGAFVALADDATAAFTNPAGLVQLVRPEVSVEGRRWSYSTPFVSGGRIEGEPSGLGLDTIAGVRTAISSNDITDVAFLSFVYPGKRWSLAIYRHVLANFEAASATQGLFAGGAACCPFRLADQRTRSVLEIISYGLSGAYRLTDDLSLGVGIVRYDSFLQLESDLYLPDDLSDSLGSPTSYLPERLVLAQTLTAEGGSTALTGGFLWRLAPSWSLGGKYRQGPEMSLGGQSLVGPALDLGVPPGTIIDFGFAEETSLPDTYGLGVAYQSVDGRLTLAFEWDRVTYSDSLDSLELEDQDIDDADELRLGGELAFLQVRPVIAIRLGAWLDPDHTTRPNERASDFTRALLVPGDDEVHFAIGFGVAFQRFQIDGALDFSDLVDTAALSAIYSF